MTQEARTMSAALLISRVRRSRQFYRWRPRKVELLLADLATAIDRATPIFPLGAVQLERAILRDSYSRVTTIEMILAELHAITADTYRDYIDDPDRRDASRIICDFIDMTFMRYDRPTRQDLARRWIAFIETSVMFLVIPPPLKSECHRTR